MAGTVTFNDPVSLGVSKFLTDNGFQLALSSGIPMHFSSTGEDELGILYKDPERKGTTFFGVFYWPPKRVFLGVLWLKNEAREANPKRWVFEARGRKYIDLIRKTATDLASEFNVDIEVRMINEDVCFESW